MHIMMCVCKKYSNLFLYIRKFMLLFTIDYKRQLPERVRGLKRHRWFFGTSVGDGGLKNQCEPVLKTLFILVQYKVISLLP